ncbi:MAG: methionine--tRNA ligase [Candidatus Bathyarchaeota archaeon]|nr:methionine--tRNA ligase [Candidatus Bathyarchaeum sp.]
MFTKFLVTSAWPYINYVPHLGNIVSSILSADVVARYYRLRGHDVVYVTGSDEHGTPIEIEAVRQNISPKELTDRNHAQISGLFERWGIWFSNYTRTENPVHTKFVHDFLLKIYENGYIFTQETEQLYCPVCDRFLPDRFVEGTCPSCGDGGARGDQCDVCGALLEPTNLVAPRCAICDASPVVELRKHWYFDLPKLSEKLRNYIESNESLPDNARNFTLNLLKAGLKPRPVTRDNKWGISSPFPGSEDKTIYVWVEAVLGYISATIQYFRRLGQEERWKEYWFDKNARTLYFIGKDNIPFHTIILPALLLATHEPYNLPWTVHSTEFLMFDGQAFSKSRRIGVWIDEALELFPADYWRYSLLSIRPEVKDTNFSWTTLLEKVNSDLNDTLGNFIHRTLTFINKQFTGTVPQPSSLDEKDTATLKEAKEIVNKTSESLEQFKLQEALRYAISLSHMGNRYFNDREPWKTIKADRQQAANTLYVAAQIVKQLAIILEPFIPFTSEKLWMLLNLEGSVHEQNWNETEKELPPNHKINKAKPLFSKIEDNEETLQAKLEEARAKLKKAKV